MSVFSGEYTSAKLDHNVTVRVLFPDSPFDLQQIDTKPKTMYLLHGFGGSSGDWLRFTRLEYLARLYNFTIVMANADNSFYSHMRHGGDYLGFFGEELPAFVNGLFRLPETTFVCGQSMGGYGALKVGLNYPDSYKAIGAFSAATDVRKMARKPPKDATAISKCMQAIFGENLEVGGQDDLYQLAQIVEKGGHCPSIVQICGTEDFLFEDNEAFDAYLTKIGYPHSYIKAPGAHMWDFWDRMMPTMMEKLCAFC